MLSSTVTDFHLSVTNIYAPSDHRSSTVFLEGLHATHTRPLAPGLVGDLNLVRGASDKNNLSLCAAFNDTIERLGVLELPLLDRLYTFRFENAWLHNSTFLSHVLPAWDERGPCQPRR